MRTIKFRGKDYETGEWTQGHFFQRLGHYPAIIEPRPRNGKVMYVETAVSDETVGQFTGLYDVNGEEIYEGDILDFNGLIIEVRFVRGVFALLCNGNLDEELCGDCRTDLFAKIIGNIHDNPDLLKGIKDNIDDF